MKKDDIELYQSCHIDDLWIYDKLLLSKHLGYTCGPKGVPVPEPGNYIIRPIYNLLGMGRGAEFVYLERDTEHIPDGFFWCERFTGDHVSIDYEYGEPILSVKGIKSPKSTYKFITWAKTDIIYPCPYILNSLSDFYQYVNCEFIGGKLIEVHPGRRNPDFVGDENEITVVWEGMDTTPPKGKVFIEDREYKRLGFWK